MSDTDITSEDAAEVEAVASAGSDTEPKAEAVAEADVEVVAEPEPEVEVDAVVEVEPEVEVDAVTEAEPEVEPEAEPASVAKPVTAAEPETAEVVGEDRLLEYDLPEEEAPKVESPFDRPGRWYVVHTQSGHEKKAQQNLAARTASMNMEERIYESVIPMEDVVEFRNGKKVVVQKKMFPGYLLVRAVLDDDAWYVIRNTPSVVNFVGAGGKPSPLIRREVENFLQIKEEGAPATPAKRSKARLEYEMGETVRVKEGPFADFSGEIVEINEDQLRVKVLVNIFGRETPVELEFSQVARL